MTAQDEYTQLYVAAIHKFGELQTTLQAMMAVASSAGDERTAAVLQSLRHHMTFSPPSQVHEAKKMRSALEEAWGKTLVEAAGKTTKKPVSGQGIRQGFYKMTDGYHASQTAVANDPATRNDHALKAALTGVDEAIDAYNEALEPYAWD